MMAERFTKATFVMDGLEGEFPGFTMAGERWNGWACPFFTKDVAEAYRFWDDPETTDDVEGDETTGQDIRVNGTPVHVYGIGNCSWCWMTTADAWPGRNEGAR
jgi:hypothetical protein